MNKYLVTLLALAITGCGFDAPDARPSQSGAQPVTTNPGTGNTGTVPSVGGLAPISFTVGTTEIGKIVLFRAFVGTRAVTVGGGFPVACTLPVGTAKDVCTYVDPSAFCDPTAALTTRYCQRTYAAASPAWDLVYIKNQSTPAGGTPATGLNTPMVVPCDGETYRAELYGSSGSTTGGTITEWHACDAFVMPAGTTTCTAPTLTWKNSTPTVVATGVVVPSLTVPSPIYAGLPTGYGEFTVGVSNIAYPWSSMTSMLAGTAKPIEGYESTFASPASAGTFTVTALFPLDASRLIGTDDPAQWSLSVTKDGTATAFGTVTVP